MRCKKRFSDKLFLFGSRTDDSKKGGDIDLLVVASSEQKTYFVEKKNSVKNEIFKYLDEQKIDITVATDTELKSDPFLISISKSLVDLDVTS